MVINNYHQFIVGVNFMEKEFKVADLAKAWGISVNATWNRIKKEKLLTVMKLDNNKEITFVVVPEDILNKYMVNKVNEVVKQDDYEVILSDDNHNEQFKNDITSSMIEFSREINNQIISLNNDYNQRLLCRDEVHNQQMMKMNEELIRYKSQIPLLEDKANREGLYINEINELKKEKQKKEHYFYVLLAVLVVFIIVIAILSVLLVKAQNKPPQVITTEKVVEKIVNVPVKVKRK